MTPHLKIALLSQEYASDCRGGICRYTYDLAHGLVDMGNEVHVISKSERTHNYEYRDGMVFVHKIRPCPLKVFTLPLTMRTSRKNLSYSYAVALKLLDLIDKRGLQIAEAPLWDAEGFVFSLVNSIPLVVRIETPLFKVAEIQGWKITRDLKLANWMEGETVRRADSVIAISKAIGELISDHHGVSRDKIIHCPLGIRTPDRELLKESSDNSTFNILFVGRIEKRKGIDTLFRVIPLILNTVPNAQFTIVGSDTRLWTVGGSYINHLLKNLDKNYQKNVNYVGFVPDRQLQRYYRDCDVFVAPSLYESFGLIYLEAMSWGKPVIGCDVGGVSEIIEDGVSGYAIPPGDEMAFFKAILSLHDRLVRVKMGERGRSIVNECFAATSFIKRTFDEYCRTVNVYRGCPRYSELKLLHVEDFVRSGLKKR